MAWIKCRGVTHVQRARELPCLTSPSFLCHSHSLLHPIVHSRLHLSRVLSVNTTSLFFHQRTKHSVASYLPSCWLFLFCLHLFQIISPSPPPHTHLFSLSFISLGIYHMFLLMQSKNNYWYAYLNSLWSFSSTIK